MALFTQPNRGEGALAVEIILGRMQQTAFGFYLTGSRVFNPRVGKRGQCDSDYDFFAQDCGEIRQWLEANGFRQLTKEDAQYLDSNTTLVWRYPHGAQIDVQLVVDLQKKMLVQAFLLTLPLEWSGIAKHARKRIWNAAFEFLH